VINADALVVKSPDGKSKKLFLSSLRPPRLAAREDGSQVIIMYLKEIGDKKLVCLIQKNS
jgi:hypothetical protein